MFSFDFYLVYIIYVVKSYSARQYQNNNLCIMSNVTGDRIRRQSNRHMTLHILNYGVWQNAKVTHRVHHNENESSLL